MKTLALLLLLLVTNCSLLGGILQNPKVRPESVCYDVPKQKNMQVNESSSAEISCYSQRLYNAKISGNRLEMESLQREIDEITGSMTIYPVKPQNCKLILPAGPPFSETTSSISINRIFSGNYTKALATATKQVPGDNEGEIWVAIARSEPTFTTDTLLIYRSTDNGVTWLFCGGTFYSGSTFNADELDIEIIESNSAERYIWVVFGRTQGLQKKAGVLVIKANSTIDSFDLGFPEHANLKYYRPRITSDNAAYYTNAWVYIVVARDSIMPGAGYSVLADERAALVLNPYSVFPPITLKPNRVGYSTYLAPSPVFRNFTDIAYYHNGEDSIVVTESNLPDSNRIYLARTSITNFVGSSSFGLGSIMGDAKWKTHCRVATNGGYKEIMIVCDQRTEFAGSNWDIAYFYGSNGANGSWTSGYIDTRPHASIFPDLVGRRNVSGKYYVSYLNIAGGNFDSITTCTATNGIWGSITEPVNNLGSAHQQPPKPGIRFSENDSCFTVWSSYSTTSNGMDVYASNGCSLPVVTGLNININIPKAYSLKQNYPNPFNPVTAISFNLPVPGYVKLEIYNLLGEIVEVIVNSNLGAGTHSFEWDGAAYSSGVYFYKIAASGFTETKKMILIK